MRILVTILMFLAPLVVFAQLGALPTIDDPQDDDRIFTYTRGFAAAFRLDTLKTYFGGRGVDTLYLNVANDSLIVEFIDGSEIRVPSGSGGGDPDQTLSVVNGAVRISGTNSDAQLFETIDGTGSGFNWNTFTHEGLYEDFIRPASTPTLPEDGHFYGFNYGTDLDHLTQIAIPMVQGQGTYPYFRIYDPGGATWDSWREFSPRFWEDNSGSTKSISDKITIGGTGTTASINITAPAISGREAIMEAKVSDAGNAQFGIGNATSSAGQFIPTFYAYNNTTRFPFFFRSLTNSANAGATEAMFHLQGGVTNSDTDPNNGSFSRVTRNLLTIENAGTVEMSVSADGDVTANSFTGDGSGLTNITAIGDNLGDHVLDSDLITGNFSIRNNVSSTVGLFVNDTGIDIYESAFNLTRLDRDELTFFGPGAQTFGLQSTAGGMRQRLGNSTYVDMPNVLPTEDKSVWLVNANGSGGEYEVLRGGEGLTFTFQSNPGTAGTWTRPTDLDFYAESGVRYGFRLSVYYSTNAGTDAEIRFDSSTGAILGDYLEGDDGVVSSLLDNTAISLPNSASKRRRTFEGTFTVTTTGTVECEVRGVTNSATLSPGTEIHYWVID